MHNLHRLEVIALLNTSTTLLAHRLAQFFSGISGGHGVDDITAGCSGQVDGLFLDGDLGDQGVEVAGLARLGF